MLIAAVVLFALAAIGGIVLAVRHFRGQPLPLPLTVVHGLAAASGLLLVLFAFLGTASAGAPLAWALGLLTTAALGGFLLLSFHLRGRRAPSAAVVIHALVALAGVLALVVTLL
jgi:hypothetical protein